MMMVRCLNLPLDWRPYETLGRHHERRLPEWFSAAPFPAPRQPAILPLKVS